MNMYGVGSSSDAISRDMNSLLYSSTFKHPSDSEFAKIKELISSDPYPSYDQQHKNNHNHNHNHSQNLNLNQTQFQNQIENRSHHHQQQPTENQGQSESSLMRYRSAPSSFFANLLDDNGCEDFLDLNPEPEERFVNRRPQQQQQQKSSHDSRECLQYSSPSSSSMKQEEAKEAAIRKRDLPTVAIYGGSSTPVTNLTTTNVNSGDTVMNPTTTSNPNLIRQSSSPAGFLSSLNVENGFAAMRDVGKGSPSGRLSNHISFSSGPSSSTRFLPQIAENGNEMTDVTFGNLKRSRDGELKMFSNLNGLDTQNGESSGHYTPSLVHHMSLPKTSSEMAAVEKFLQFQQDSVPCKIRAKRGYATHPRSIAERVRRTRISERIKKLQELFPNMDKQTNTADMLDMAVEYIKDLQKEVQALNDARARCTCSSTIGSAK